MTATSNQLYKKYGGKAAFSKIMKERGALGGKAKVPKGFAKMDKKRLTEVSKRAINARILKRKNSGLSIV